MRKRLKIFNCIMSVMIIISSMMFYKIGKIPSTIFIRQGESLQSNTFIKLQEVKAVNANMVESNNEDKRVNVSLLGLLPVRSVSLKSIPEMEVYPGGQPLGIKLKTKGVLVVALSDIDTEEGRKTSPAAVSGIQIGDSILKINNKNVKRAEDISKIVNRYSKKEISILIKRKDKEVTKKVAAIKSSSDGKYKLGLWVRDSTAGVGTLTFYDAKTQKFAALGHPITDIDTGKIMSVETGEIVSSNILSVKKGMRGDPGELKGIFVDEEKSLGKISKNTECGIFGVSKNNLVNKKFDKPIKIALRNEIQVGKAKVLTTIEGKEPKLYDIEIEKLLNQDEAGPKSMIIKVTDEELIKKTGGIVQGMSGSPIIQNNKLVGAVTHVLINKPDVGYGIYIEWMIKDAEILSK